MKKPKPNHKNQHKIMPSFSLYWPTHTFEQKSYSFDVKQKKQNKFRKNTLSLILYAGGAILIFPILRSTDGASSIGFLIDNLPRPFLLTICASMLAMVSNGTGLPCQLF